MRIEINWPDPRLAATVKCPKLDQDIEVRDCWAVKETEGKDGIVKVDQLCEYFSNMEIGYIVCTYGEGKKSH